MSVDAIGKAKDMHLEIRVHKVAYALGERPVKGSKLAGLATWRCLCGRAGIGIAQEDRHLEEVINV